MSSAQEEQPSPGSLPGSPAAGGHTNQRAAIVMTPAEIESFINQQRTMTLGTVGPDGRPHLVAMWYAVIDGAIWFETKAKSQKAFNLKRDNRVTCSLERGLSYDRLRGVCIDGLATVSTCPEDLWAVGVGIFERYQGTYDESMRPLVEMMINNRVAIRVDPSRIRSWDHRKLGLPPMAPGGTTAEAFGQ